MNEETHFKGYRQRLKAKEYQGTLDVQQTVENGFNLHFKNIAKADVDTVLKTLSNSFNLCSILIQKSKRGDGGTA